MFKVSKKHYNNLINIFKVNSKDNTTTSVASVVIFGHILHFIIIVEFNQINVDWAWETVVSDNRFVFSNWKKYIALWVREIFWATYFHSFSSNISLGKDKF